MARSTVMPAASRRASRSASSVPARARLPMNGTPKRTPSSSENAAASTDNAAANTTLNLSDYATGHDTLGLYDAFGGGAGKLNLTRGLELLYQNGASTVYARPLR